MFISMIQETRYDQVSISEGKSANDLAREVFWEESVNRMRIQGYRYDVPDPGEGAESVVEPNLLS